MIAIRIACARLPNRQIVSQWRALKTSIWHSRATTFAEVRPFRLFTTLSRNRMLESLTAKEYIQRMKRADLPLDEKSVNEMIKFWSQNEDLQKALDFVEELKNHKFKLHSDSLASMLPLCAKTGADDKVAASLIQLSGIKSLDQLPKISTEHVHGPKCNHAHDHLQHHHPAAPVLKAAAAAPSSPPPPKSSSSASSSSSSGGSSSDDEGSIPDPTAPDTVEGGYRVSRGLSWMFWLLPILCFLLGSWQIYRWDRKQKLKAIRAAKFAAPVEDLPVFTSKEQAVENELRTFRVTGKFLYDHEIAVGPRPNAGTVGYLLVTPFLTNTGRVILVNRGWVPKELRERSQRTGASYFEPEGEVTLQITLRPNAPVNTFSPPNNVSKRQFFRINAADLAAAEQSLKPEVLVYDNRTAPPPKSANVLYPQPPDTFFPLPDNHMEYIITWYSLGTFLTWMTYRLRKGEKLLAAKTKSAAP